MIQPTRRLLGAVAATAPAGLALALAFPGLWAAGLGLLAFVLLAAAADGLLAARDVRVRLHAPGAVAVGEAFALHLEVGAGARTVEVAVDLDPLLDMPDGHRRTMALYDGFGSADVPTRGLRRGTARLPHLWARWTGPLGLLARVRRVAAGVEIAVTPHLRPVRRAAAAMRADRPHGTRAQTLLGEGAEFDSLAEYRPGTDRRSIDWKASARHGELLAKEWRLERNNLLIACVDSGRAMAEPLDGAPKLDRAVSAALLTAFVALRDGDRVGLFSFDSVPRVRTEPLAGPGAFAHLQRLAAGIDYHPGETNFTLGLSTLAARLSRRALVVIFTEFADPAGAELMLAAVRPLLKRHLVLFTVFHDTELDAFVEAPPVEAEDVAQAVAAHRLQRERRLVIGRLKRMGAEVLEADAREAGPQLVERYLDLKRRGRL